MKFALLLLLLCSTTALASIQSRLVSVSSHYVGRPYHLDPLGEGEDGKYDRDPLYRFDAFDCTTFVETMMALALSPDNDHESFVRTLTQIRYKNGEVSYGNRNHFPEIDWIPNNIKAGFIQDITARVAGRAHLDLARALIEKRAWYEHKTLASLNVPGLNGVEKEVLLSELRDEGRNYGTELSVLPYIHLKTLFHRGRANKTLFSRIPTGTLIAIVRPNWDMTGTEGTHLNISHQGLIVRKRGKLFIRHATTGKYQRIVDLPLISYLHGFINHPTIKGINLLSLSH